MTNDFLEDLRKLAKNKQIQMTGHGQGRMFERGYFLSDIEKILCSRTNQIVERQSPSQTPGKEHKDERILISDPMFSPDTVVLISLDLSNPMSPKIVVITVEPAIDSKWEKHKENDPWLVRKTV